MGLVGQLLGLIPLACAIWIIYDVWAKQKFKTGKKVLWTVLAVLFSVITAIVYFFMVKKK